MSAVPPPSRQAPPLRGAAPTRVLRRVFEHGAYADQALVAEARGLDARDRALAMRLAYGAVQRARHARSPDRALRRAPARRGSTRPCSPRCGSALYELLYLDGAPDHAVVADAVELAKRRRRAGHGLVNAVLRRAVREDARGARSTALRDATPEQAALRALPPRVDRAAVVGGARRRRRRAR